MKNRAKLIVLAVLGVLVIGISLGIVNQSDLSGFSLAQLSASPTPSNTANGANTANVVANAVANAVPPSETGDKKIPKSFVLGKDSLTEYGEVHFDHDTHAFGKYSPDGKSAIGCVECHHTDQPKSALKPPLVTSERDVVLTLETWRASTQKVSNCRACHFQDGDVPDDKEMPTATYTEGGKSVVKDLNNELAYHINCNTCHDDAFKLRPEVKSKKGFATSKDCLICHMKN